MILIQLYYGHNNRHCLPDPSMEKQGGFMKELWQIRICLLRFLIRQKFERDGVNGVSLARRRRSIVEQMAEMCSATDTENFSSNHAEGGILTVVDASRMYRFGKARPSACAGKLRTRTEQCVPAGRTVIGPPSIEIQVFTRKSPLSSPVPCHPVKIRRQHFFPYRVRQIKSSGIGTRICGIGWSSSIT